MGEVVLLGEGGRRHGPDLRSCPAIWEWSSIFPTPCLSPMGKVGFLLASETWRIVQMLQLWALSLHCHPQLP